MQNPIKKIGQSSTDFEKPGILSEKFGNFDELQLPTMFFAGILYTSSTYQCLQKDVRHFSYFV